MVYFKIVNILLFTLNNLRRIDACNLQNAEDDGQCRDSGNTEQDSTPIEDTVVEEHQVHLLPHLQDGKDYRESKDSTDAQ